MTGRIHRRAGGMVCSFMLGLMLFSSSAMPAFAVTGTWKMGASIYSVSAADFASDDFYESLRRLRKAGANYVSFVIPYHQKNEKSSTIAAGPDTPSDETLKSAIRFAHSIGLEVMLKPHLAPDEGNAWRAYIDARDRKKWFASYGAMLNHLGDIGRETGAQGICMGTELISMSSSQAHPRNTEHWKKMIADLRARFPGFITYSANWGGSEFMNEADTIEFWSDLDYIGISAYYPLASDAQYPTLDQLKGSWDYWNSTRIQPLQEKYQKPILFTEVGYRSVQGAHVDPWDGTREGVVDLQVQEKLYEALFQYWNTKPYLAGVMMWDWTRNPDGGGHGDNQYTIQRKPAQDMLGRWFANASTTRPYQEIEIVSPQPGPAKPELTVFKARLRDAAPTEYALYWQVNGGPLVLMENSRDQSGYKESSVHLEGWNWNKAGLYFVNFVAKDGLGAILSQKSATLSL